MNRILCSPDEVDDAGVALLADRRADHILRVLRAAPGQVLRAGILDGPAADATVMTMDGGTVRIQLSAYGPAPARARVDLLLALPRPKVLKRLLPQLAALGIDRLILANARKVERYYFDSHVLAPEFCHAQFVEGLQQAGHTRLPRVSIHRRLKILIEDEAPRQRHQRRRFSPLASWDANPSFGHGLRLRGGNGRRIDRGLTIPLQNPPAGT